MWTKTIKCCYCNIEVLWENVNFVEHKHCHKSRKEYSVHNTGQILVCDECYNKHIVSEYNRIKEDV